MTPKIAARLAGKIACAGLIALASVSSPAQSPVIPSREAYVLDLATVLRLAGAQNLDVQLARNAVEESRANYVSAIERFVPALVPSATYLRHSGRTQAVDGNVLDVTKHSDTTGVGVTAQVVVGDAVFTALQSRRLLQAADAAATTRERDSALAAAQQYFDLVRARALVNVVEQAHGVSQNYQRQLEEAVRIGIAFKGDELRVLTQTQRLELDLARAKQQQRLASAKLVQTLHLDPLLELAPAEAEPAPLALVDLAEPLPVLVQSALDNRAELDQSRALSAAAEQARRGAVYGPLLPTIGAQAFAGNLNGGPGDIDANGGTTRDRTVGLSWKIGPGGLLDWGRIKASNARLRAAELSDQKLRDEISRQVVEGYTRVQSLFEQLRIARLNMASASDTLQLTRGRKELGVGTVLEDIQAQQEVLRARSEYLGSVTELNQEQFGLLRAIGAALRLP